MTWAARASIFSRSHRMGAFCRESCSRFSAGRAQRSSVAASEVPRATPIQSAILQGELETGLSIMLMDAGLDTGEIVLQQTVAIEPEENYGELHGRLAALGAELLGQCIALAERGELAARPQIGEPTVTRPINREDLRVDLSGVPERIVRAVRAYAPQPAARAESTARSSRLCARTSTMPGNW